MYTFFLKIIKNLSEYFERFVIGIIYDQGYRYVMYMINKIVELFYLASKFSLSTIKSTRNLVLNQNRFGSATLGRSLQA